VSTRLPGLSIDLDAELQPGNTGSTSNKMVVYALSGRILRIMLDTVGVKPMRRKTGSETKGKQHVTERVGIS
jgi:hypothetical protein